MDVVGNGLFLSSHYMDDGWWELKLRYCPVKVGLRYTDVLIALSAGAVDYTDSTSAEG